MALLQAGCRVLVSPRSWRGQSSCSARRRSTKRYAVSVDVQESTDEDTTSITAAGAVEQVPLPQAFPEDGVSIVVPPVTSLDDLPELRESASRPEDEDGAISGFSLELDKNQSLWLLNVVSFLYGTNTTVCFCTHTACLRRIYASTPAMDMLSLLSCVRGVGRGWLRLSISRGQGASLSPLCVALPGCTEACAHALASGTHPLAPVCALYACVVGR